MPNWRQVVVYRDVAVLGGVIVSSRQARGQRGLGPHRVSVMDQRAGLLIGTTVSLWLGVSPPLAVRELRKLPGGRP